MKTNMNGIVLNDRLSGFISAKEFKKNWKPEILFQWYQRARVTDKRKIHSLKGLFQANKGIDAITLNLVGDYSDGSGVIKLDGELHVIDGQQRLSALMESECDYDMPVVVHYNLSAQEEVSMFESLNRTQTKLSIGEHVKTCQGFMADQFRLVIANNRYPIKVTIRKSGLGISASTYCSLLHWTYYRMRGEKLNYPAAGNSVINFMSKDVTEIDAQKTALALRRVLEKFVSIYGTYSSLAMAYKRGFMLAWCHVVIDNFLSKDCSIEDRGFEQKLDMSKLLQDSYVRELIGGNTSTHGLLYNRMIEHLNHKKRMDRLPNIDGIIENVKESDNE